MAGRALCVSVSLSTKFSGSFGPFRGHRRFIAGRWLIYYRVLDDKVYLRALYPARLP